MVVYLIVEGFDIMLIDLLIDVLATLVLNLIGNIVNVDNAKPSPLITSLIRQSNYTKLFQLTQF